jgi:hypothetical protein
MPVVLMALAAAAFALAWSGEPNEPSPMLALTGQHGAIEIANSKPGHAILSAQNMSPGDVARGKVGVRNVGSMYAEVSLAAHLKGGQGPNGGELGDSLMIRVRRPRSPRRPAMNVYRGRLVEMPAIDLGRWRPGGSRRYRFMVSWPDRGSRPQNLFDDNLFQGSWARVRFIWMASG